MAILMPPDYRLLRDPGLMIPKARPKGRWRIDPNHWFVRKASQIYLPGGGATLYPAKGAQKFVIGDAYEEGGVKIYDDTFDSRSEDTIVPPTINSYSIVLCWKDGYLRGKNWNPLISINTFDANGGYQYPGRIVLQRYQGDPYNMRYYHNQNNKMTFGGLQALEKAKTIIIRWSEQTYLHIWTDTGKILSGVYLARPTSVNGRVIRFTTNYDVAPKSKLFMHAYFWNYLLSDTEVASIQRDPYQFLIPA